MGGLIGWSSAVLGLTFLFHLLTLTPAQKLATPAAQAECAQSPYCAPNLALNLPYRFWFETPDTKSYFDPIRNLFHHGTYQPDYRLPGYGLLYGFFYSLGKSPALAIWAVGLAQFLLWSLALGLWLRHLGRLRAYRFLGYLGLWLISLSPTAVYVRYLLPEAFALASGLLALYALFQRSYFWAGLGLTWAFFLRPVLGVWLLPAGLWILYAEGPALPRILRSVWQFTLPFAFAEGAWIGRNYLLYGDFRPLDGTKSLVDPYFRHTLLGDIVGLLRQLGANVPLQWNSPREPFALLTCRGEGDPAVWQAAFKALAASPVCPPESLYAWHLELCRLAQIYPYLLEPRPPYPEEPTLTPEACAIEGGLSQRLHRCTAWLKREYPLSGPFWAALYRLNRLRTVPSAQETLWRRLYYEVFFWLALVGLSTLAYLALRRGGKTWVWLGFSLLPLVIYWGLGYVERRYWDLQWPLILLGLGEGLRPRQDSNLQPRD